MSFARQFQDINVAARRLYSDLFNSVSADLRNYTDSYNNRRFRIYMSVFDRGTTPILDACMSIIQDEEMNRPLPGTMQQHIHKTMCNELRIVRNELTSGCDMTAAPSRPFC